MNLPTRPRLTGSLQEGIQRPMPPHVSILGNRFTLVDGAGAKAGVETFDPKLGPYLDCVITDVNAKVSRIYYEADYDPDSPGAPACYSDNGVAPSVNASNKQAPRCDLCPKAEWGSATSKLTGKGVPACRQYKKMAILIPGYGDMVFMLAVPPASLKAAQAYSQKVDAYKVDLPDIVTRISFAPGVLGTLVFEAIEHASPEMKAYVDKIWENPNGCAAIVGRNDQPAQIEHQPPAHGFAVDPETTKPAPQPGQFPAKTLQAPLTPFGQGQLQQAPKAVQEKKPRGRPKTVAEPPKAALEQPRAPFAPQPQAEQGKFGVVENPPAPDAAMANTLDNLFKTNFD